MAGRTLAATTGDAISTTVLLEGARMDDTVCAPPLALPLASSVRARLARTAGEPLPARPAPGQFAESPPVSVRVRDTQAAAREPRRHAPLVAVAAAAAAAAAALACAAPSFTACAETHGARQARPHVMYGYACGGL